MPPKGESNMLRLLLRSSLEAACKPAAKLNACGCMSRMIHTSASDLAWEKQRGPRKWSKYNEKMYPPQEIGEERRPAFVCHLKKNIKYSPWKMWYIACLVRGMSVDEALKQLAFVSKKGAVAISETIREAQKLAQEQHHVEYKSNLWVAESFVGKGEVIRGYRRHARGRFGKVEYFYCHYFVRLEEGSPPKDYYFPKPSAVEMLQDWIQEKRSRNIAKTL